MHLLRLFALALRNQGADVIDQCTKVLTEWQSLSEAATFLKNKGVTLPAAVTNEAIKEPFNTMKCFLCVCSAWDLMLGQAPSTKRQRHADVEAFKSAVKANCANVFPASLMNLVDAWKDGKDVASMMRA